MDTSQKTIVQPLKLAKLENRTCCTAPFILGRGNKWLATGKRKFPSSFVILSYILHILSNFSCLTCAKLEVTLGQCFSRASKEL